MTAFNPYLIDEIVTEASAGSSYFGLIIDTEADRTELYGYEVSMSGSLVIPELHPRPQQTDDENRPVNQGIA